MKVNYKKLYRLLLPTFLRKASVMMYLDPAFVELQDLKKKIDDFITLKVYDLTVTPQVWSLEKMLNERICKGRREIEICETEGVEIPYFHRPTDEKDVYFGDDETDVSFFDGSGNGYLNTFIVKVPAKYIGRDDEIVALVNRYKLSSKTFEIQFI